MIGTCQSLILGPDRPFHINIGQRHATLSSDRCSTKLKISVSLVSSGVRDVSSFSDRRFFRAIPFTDPHQNQPPIFLSPFPCQATMSSSRLAAILAWFCAWAGRFADRHPAPHNLRGRDLICVPMVLVVGTTCILACIELRLAQPDPGDEGLMIETVRTMWRLSFPPALLSLVLGLYLMAYRSSPAVCKSFCYFIMNNSSFVSAVLWYAGFWILCYRPGAYWTMALNSSPVILGVVSWCILHGLAAWGR